MYRRYIRHYLLFLGLFSLPLAVGGLMSLKAHEITSMRRVVELQLSQQAIYGTAFSQNTYGYKLELVRMVRPEVVALGSSRALQFRREAFTASFVNAGGAMNNLIEGHGFLQDMLAFHHPGLVILCLDFWWFNPAVIQRQSFDYHNTQGDELTHRKLVGPYLHLLEGRVSLKLVRDLVLGGQARGGPAMLGLAALAGGEGFRPDGSRFHGRTVQGLNPDFPDREFKATLRKVSLGRDGFQTGKSLDPDRVELLRRIIDLCRDNGVELALVIPPVSDAVRQAMDRVGGYDHIRLVELLPGRLGVEGHDFHRLDSVGSSDCECLDGFHGGDVTYLRMLQAMARSGSVVARYLDLPGVERAIDRDQGRAMAVFPGEARPMREVDFLGLGCPKGLVRASQPQEQGQVQDECLALIRAAGQVHAVPGP